MVRLARHLDGLVKVDLPNAVASPGLPRRLSADQLGAANDLVSGAANDLVSGGVAVAAGGLAIGAFTPRRLQGRGDDRRFGAEPFQAGLQARDLVVQDLDLLFVFGLKGADAVLQPGHALLAAGQGFFLSGGRFGQVVGPVHGGQAGGVHSGVTLTPVLG